MAITPAFTTPNKLDWGLAKVYWCKVTETVDSETGAVTDTYDTPAQLKGTRALNFTPSGEMTKVYADGTLYYTGKQNNGYDATLEVYAPDEAFLKYVTGDVEDDNAMLVENQTSATNRFAILWEWDGDDHKTRHIAYNCTANRPDMNATTSGDGGTKSAQAQSISVVCAPRYDGVVKAKTQTGTSATVYNGWFNAVQQPTFTPTSGGGAGGDGGIS